MSGPGPLQTKILTVLKSGSSLTSEELAKAISDLWGTPVSEGSVRGALSGMGALAERRWVKRENNKFSITTRGRALAARKPIKEPVMAISFREYMDNAFFARAKDIIKSEDYSATRVSFKDAPLDDVKARRDAIKARMEAYNSAWRDHRGSQPEPEGYALSLALKIHNDYIADREKDRGEIISSALARLPPEALAYVRQLEADSRDFRHNLILSGKPCPSL